MRARWNDKLLHFISTQMCLCLQSVLREVTQEGEGGKNWGVSGVSRKSRIFSSTLTGLRDSQLSLSGLPSHRPVSVCSEM